MLNSNATAMKRVVLVLLLLCSLPPPLISIIEPINIRWSLLASKWIRRNTRSATNRTGMAVGIRMQRKWNMLTHQPVIEWMYWIHMVTHGVWMAGVESYWTSRHHVIRMSRKCITINWLAFSDQEDWKGKQKLDQTCALKLVECGEDTKDVEDVSPSRSTSVWKQLLKRDIHEI